MVLSLLCPDFGCKYQQERSRKLKALVNCLGEAQPYGTLFLVSGDLSLAQLVGETRSRLATTTFSFDEQGAEGRTHDEQH